MKFKPLIFRCIVFFWAIVSLVVAYKMGKHDADKWYAKRDVCEWYIYKDGRLFLKCAPGCSEVTEPAEKKP